MLQSILKFLIGTATGRMILAGAVMLGGAAAAHFYLVDQPAQRRKAAIGSAHDRIEAMADALDEAIDKQGKTVVGQLPERSQWYPSDLACGAIQKFPAQREPIWDVLKVKAGQKTGYQYRFGYRDGRIEIIGRRDSDCDGLYAVWTLRAPADESSVGARRLSEQNVHE